VVPLLHAFNLEIKPKIYLTQYKIVFLGPRTLSFSCCTKYLANLKSHISYLFYLFPMAGLAFSVITTGIFLYPVIDSLIKPNPDKATLVHFTLGSTGLHDDSGPMGGSVPTVAVYTEDGTQIGISYGSSKKAWSAGSEKYVTINPNKGMDGRQATYVTVVTGGNDALCISALSVAWPDGTAPKVWLGDMGQKCATTEGPFWANSATQTGSDPQFQSKCVWIDGDGTDGITTKGFSLHIVDFGRTDGATTNNGEPTTNPVADQWNENNDLLCKAPGRMNFSSNFQADTYPWIYQPPLQYNTDGTDKDPNAVLNGVCNPDPEFLQSQCSTTAPNKKPESDAPVSKRYSQSRRLSKRSTQMSRTLVHSSSAAHSAEELCNHPASISPSFVSYQEGKFCDMVTRTLWPLCSQTAKSGCYDARLNRLVINSKRLKSSLPNHISPNGTMIWERVVRW
jgi:hypothetical protein